MTVFKNINLDNLLLSFNTFHNVNKTKNLKFCLKHDLGQISPCNLNLKSKYIFTKKGLHTLSKFESYITLFKD